MKVTRRQLRKLINEAVYKFGKPPRTVDYEMKRFNQERERSNARIDSMLSQRARTNLADFDENDPEYAEEFRLGLDPDRPEIIRLRQTFETVSVYRHHDLEIEIPQELVNDVIDAHLAAQSGGFAAGSVFRQAAIRVFHHIENEVKRIAGNDKNVYEYGLSTRGHRAHEYAEAMEAVGAYI
jgi:hypothetical protein